MTMNSAIDFEQVLKRACDMLTGVDAVVYLLIQPQYHRHRQRAYEVLSQYDVGHLNVGQLVQWLVEGEDALIKRLKDLGAYPPLTRYDVHEWLASLAWLCIKASGETDRLMESSYQANWVCRSFAGQSNWYAIGLDDSSSSVETADGSKEYLRIWIYMDSGEPEEQTYYRVCCYQRRDEWPGLASLGIKHPWNDCMFYGEADEDDYDDEYE